MRVSSALGIALFLLNTISCSSQELISDAKLSVLFPEHPDITIFRPEYLEFFADDSQLELKKTKEYGRGYVLEGDFDYDGVDELAITGLLSIDPIDGKYNCFISILSERDGSYEIDFFQRFYKTVGFSNTIQNMVLLWSDEFGLRIGFKMESEYMASIEYQDGDYAIRMGSSTAPSRGKTTPQSLNWDEGPEQATTGDLLLKTKTNKAIGKR